MMAKKKKTSKRKRNKIILLIFFVVVAIGLVAGLSFTVFFPVKQIEVLGSMVYSDDELISAAQISKKDNLLLLDEEEILLKVQSQCPYIESLKIEKKLPDKVILNFSEVSTYYYFSKDNTGYRTDTNFRILPVGIDIADFTMGIRCDFKLDETSGKVVINSSDDAELIKKVTRACENSGITPNVLDLSVKGCLKLTVEDRFEVDFGSRYDFDGKFAQLVTMIKEIDKEKTGRINLSEWTSENTEGYFVETFAY